MTVELSSGQQELLDRIMGEYKTAPTGPPQSMPGRVLLHLYETGPSWDGKDENDSDGFLDSRLFKARFFSRDDKRMYVMPGTHDEVEIHGPSVCRLFMDGSTLFILYNVRIESTAQSIVLRCEEEPPSEDRNAIALDRMMGP